MAPKLADALERGWRGSFTSEEAAEIARIEALRSEVDASTRIIRTTGPEWSGNPDDPRVVDLPLGELSQSASKGQLSARVLFSLIRAFQPATAIELGSCVGISAAYQAAALELNGTGVLISCEAAAQRLAAAREHVASLGLSRVRFEHGRFSETLGPLLEQLDDPLDYAFIDGHHDEKATLAYFEQILPHASDSAVFVFDDIHWSEGMERAWEYLRRHPSLPLSVDLRDMGIACASAP
jgi:predicted O-methyltransferase YrrM